MGLFFRSQPAKSTELLAGKAPKLPIANDGAPFMKPLLRFGSAAKDRLSFRGNFGKNSKLKMVLVQLSRAAEGFLLRPAANPIEVKVVSGFFDGAFTLNIL